MKDKTFAGLFGALCLALCGSLFLGMLVFGPATASANEVLTPLPRLRSEEGTWNRDYFPELAGYVTDHFWGRSRLITLHNRLQALTGSSGENSVILGKEGWLFYASTLTDYTGTEAQGDRDLYGAARNLYLMQECCQSRGMTFSFVLAPDKNALYPQYFPDYGVTADQRDGQRLLELLDSLSVCHTDLYAAFQAREQTLYFAHDSHWNSRGAALAADCILESLNRESSYFSDDFSQSQPHTGDLWEMLYPAASDPETDPVYGGSLTYSFEGPAARADSINLVTNGQGTGRLYAWRDSFGNLLYPYLADSFSTAQFSRSVTYDLSRPAAMDADTVVLELVERNLSQLTWNPPVLASPLRSWEIQEKGDESISLSAPENAPAPEGRITLVGTAPLQRDWDSPVCLLCSEGAYEACLGSQNSFTVYVPQDAIPEQVLVRVDGCWTAYPVDTLAGNET